MFRVCPLRRPILRVSLLLFLEGEWRGGRSTGTSLSLSLSLSVCVCVCVHVRSVTALELVPVPIQLAAVFRDARSVFIRDRAHFFFNFLLSSSSLFGRVQCPV
jgi:hypothetical protein